MELPTSSEVLSTIDAFLTRHGMAPSRFGSEATGDANLVAELRKGLSPRLNRLHRIKAYMARIDREAAVEHVATGSEIEDRSASGKALDLTGAAS